MSDTMNLPNGEWKEYSLEELAVIFNDKRVPLSSMERSKKKGSFPYYGASGVIDSVDDYLFDGEYVLISEDGENLKSRQTPIAFIANGKFWVNNHAHIVKGKKKYLNQLLVYYFANLDLNPYLTGAVQPKLNKANLISIPIYLPQDESEQAAIASVLSSLDDKIDLLHRQNATLERMAETLFRQWFVEEATDVVVDLGDYADNIRKNARVEDLVQYENYVGLEHIPKKSISLYEWGKTDNLASNKSVFKENDILFGKLRSYFHKVVFAPINGVCSTDILVIKSKQPEWFSFCLFWFSNPDLVEYSDLGAGGTRMPRTSWEIISSYKIPKPDADKIAKFNEFTLPLIEKIKFNQTQIRTLTALRDTLLPKLMSGEVRVEV